MLKEHGFPRLKSTFLLAYDPIVLFCFQNSSYPNQRFKIWNYYFVQWQNHQTIVVLKTIKLLKCTWKNYCIASVFFDRLLRNMFTAHLVNAQLRGDQINIQRVGCLYPLSGTERVDIRMGWAHQGLMSRDATVWASIKGKQQAVKGPAMTERAVHGRRVRRRRESRGGREEQSRADKMGCIQGPTSAGTPKKWGNRTTSMEKFLHLTTCTRRADIKSSQEMTRRDAFKGQRVVTRTAAEVHTLICEFVYVFNLYRNMILFGGSSRYFVRDNVYVARFFCGCPACASSADVSVRKCHGIFFCVLPPYSSCANYIRNGYRWCVVIRKPGSTRLEGTPAMDHKINGKRIQIVVK